MIYLIICTLFKINYCLYMYTCVSLIVWCTCAPPPPTTPVYSLLRYDSLDQREKVVAKANDNEVVRETSECMIHNCADSNLYKYV